MEKTHVQLERLIKRYLPEDLNEENYDLFFQALSKAFDDADDSSMQLQRSLELANEELAITNSELRAQLRENQSHQLQLEKAFARQKTILDATAEVVFSVSPLGKFTEFNPAASTCFGIGREQALKLNKQDAQSLILDKLLDPTDFLDALCDIESDHSLRLQGIFETRDKKYYEYYSVPEFLDNKFLGRVWCWRDITDARNKQDLLKYQAFHDALTGLPNRLLLLQSLLHAIRLAKRNNTRVVVMFIDLDDFKKINDTAGHQEGDRFLIHVSKRIQEVLRESDIMGRLGGDEFLVILEGVHHQHEIIQVHDRIINIFRKPFVINNCRYAISCSIGMSLYPQDDNNPEELIRKADMAMYQAKRNGKNTFHYFDESLERIAIHRVSIESDLRETIKSGRFVLHYQPKIDLVSKRMVGVETLIRWVEQDGSLRYPDTFIAVAENTGLIRNITRWVLEEVCKKLVAWKGSYLDGIPISVNISAIDFSDLTFLEQTLAIFARYDIDYRLLEFELTESVFSDDIRRIKDTIAAFKERNILVSIDDFGTGYSSFSYLQDLEVDYLKIDRSFVQGVHTREKSQAIVKSIVDVGINLGFKIVAEGIENEYELRCLQDMRCHIGQGYHFSRPVSETELITYFRNASD